MWLRMDKVSKARAWLASAHHPSLGMLFSGGWDAAEAETSNDGKDIIELPPMPVDKCHHCMAVFDRGRQIKIFNGLITDKFSFSSTSERCS